MLDPRSWPVWAFLYPACSYCWWTSLHPPSGSVSHSVVSLCDPMDCSLPGCSAYGILQARILEWVAIPSSRGSSWPRDQTQVFYIAGRLFTVWATREALTLRTNSYFQREFDSSFLFSSLFCAAFLFSLKKKKKALILIPVKDLSEITTLLCNGH